MAEPSESLVRIGDKWFLTITEELPGGTLTKRLQWSHHPTPEQLAGAHRERATPLELGEELLGRRWVLGPLTVFYFKSVGPPRWRLPRLYPLLVRGGIEFRCGWNFTAHAVSFHFWGG